MVKRSLANASIVVSVIMIAVAAVGWWRVGSLSTDVNEAQSEVALQREKTSELTDDLEDMRDDLMQVEDALARARARAQRADAERLAMQDCVSAATDEDQAGGQTVVFGFLKIGEGRQVLIDEAQWYVGDDANRAALEDGELKPGDSVPNDYYIRNDSHSRVPLGVAEDVVVVTTTADRHNIPAPKCQTWKAFARLIHSSDPWRSRVADSPYWVTVVDGAAVRLLEQYRP